MSSTTRKTSAASPRHSRRTIAARDDWKLAGETAQPQEVILEWLKAYTERGCIPSRDLIIRAHLRLVAYFAQRMASPDVPFDDLMAEGVMRLMRCMDLYDASRGVTFSTYAAVVLRTNMRRSVSRTSQLVRIPDRPARQHKDRARQASLYYLKNGRKPLPEELPAAAAGQSLESSGLPTWCADAIPEDAVDRRLGPVEAAAKADAATTLSRAIAKLPAPSADLICKRFGVLGERRHSVHELSARLGITRQAVSDAITRACTALKNAIGGDELSSLQLA